MRFTIGQYELNITARDKHTHTRYDKKDTVTLLCEISNGLFYAEEQMKKQGYPATAKRYGDLAEDIIKALSARGYFDTVK